MTLLFIGVREVDEDAEEELDKPGTTIERRNPCGDSEIPDWLQNSWKIGG